jgi:hypothetical protein
MRRRDKPSAEVKRMVMSGEMARFNPPASSKAAGADETGKEFERMFKKIVTRKKQHKTQPVMGLLLKPTFLFHYRSVAV